MVDGGEEEGDVPIVRAIRLDHIDEGGPGGVAQMVHPVPNVHIRRGGPAALGVFVQPVRVHQLGSRLGREKGALRVLVQQRVGEGPIADDADDDGKQHQQQHDAENALYGGVPFQQFHGFTPQARYVVVLPIHRKRAAPRKPPVDRADGHRRPVFRRLPRPAFVQL